MMLTLQETFRQLALDLNAVAADDPSLSDFSLKDGGTDVTVHFRDYKTELEISARNYVDGRPRFRIGRRGFIDKLGQRLGTDARQVPADHDFNASYEMVTFADEDFDPISLRDTIASIFAADAARAAVRQLDQDRALPVLVTSSGVQWETASASKRTLQQARVKQIVAGVAALARALPNAKAAKKSNAPLVDGDGRKRIRRERGDSLLSKIWAVFDLWPMYLLMAGTAVVTAWFTADVHFVAHRVWLAAAAFGAPLLLVAPLSLLFMKGSENALALSLWRSLGVAVFVAMTVYFGAHALDILADTAASTTETMTVTAVRPALGPLPGATTLRSPRQTLRVMSDDFGKAGSTVRIETHRGRLGWRWFERAPDRD